MDLYSDVMLKIHSHYVERPDWLPLLQRGTAALEIALSESAFQERNNIRLTETVVQSHFSELNHALARQPVRTRQESRDVVHFIAQSTATRLGISAPTVILEYACAAGASLDDYSAFLTGNQLDEIIRRSRATLSAWASS